MPVAFSDHPSFAHTRDFRGYGERGLPELKWPGGAKVAVSFVINYEEGGERSPMAGDGQSEPNLRENPMGGARINTRDLNSESEYEFGSRAGWWRLFRLFNNYNMKFTLYGVAQALEQVPEVAARCVEKGHDVASHAYRWLDYHEMGVEQEKDFIRKGIQSLKKITGYAPKGWYYGRPSPQSHVLISQVYEEMGEELVWASDTYADEVPYWKDRVDKPDSGVLMVPYSYCNNDFIFSGFRDPDGFYKHLKNAFDVLYEEGEEGNMKMMTIGLHCRIIGQPARFKALKDFVDYVSKKEGAWVATRTKIAEAFREQFPYKKGTLASGVETSRN